ncbi:MAG: hypothetical protein JSV64_05430 [Candidatus Bathyarchaeota archaeon]|nr:MAG: hypothetical protein JSV64_05430 [Candidatus Bathyarchaeota archaeon]
MIVSKHVEYEFRDADHLEKLLEHVRETTSQIGGVKLNGIYFPKGRREFVLAVECVSEDKYLEWRDACPPPAGAKDWYEVYLTREERYPERIP